MNTKGTDLGLTNAVAGSLKSSENKIELERVRNKDKADRATVENCLDPRTMKEIEKMLANKKLDVFSGCISTGKEANVYLASGSMDINKREPFPPDEQGNIPVKEYAVKVFKTSILVFKDRERYVSGEFRFRNGHCKGNPRKMVALWAEKEVRNLKRLALTEGLIRAPIPHFLKNNIIVMDFLGENGVPAPRLRDAQIDDWRVVYDQTILMIRRLYQRCHLIHADLSEYNLLYFQSEIWMIDVSQSVEHDHPMALDFLRRDCSIMSDFFERKKINVLGIQQVFNFTTDMEISNDDEETVLQQMLQELDSKTPEEIAKRKSDDTVFRQIYIPRTLQELSLDEILKLKKNNQEDVYASLTGLKSADDSTPNDEVGEEQKVETK